MSKHDQQETYRNAACGNQKSNTQGHIKTLMGKDYKVKKNNEVY